jgi:hypothetical protein
MKIQLPPVIDTLIKISRSEAGPDALPASMPWLRLTIGTYVLGLAIDGLLDYSPLKAVAIAVLAPIILGAFTAGSLYLVGLGKRLTQTLLALTGTGTIIALVTFAVHFVIILGLPSEIPVGDFAGYLMFPLYFWNAVVFTAIFNAALSSGKIVGLAISVTYLVAVVFWLPTFFK